MKMIYTPEEIHAMSTEELEGLIYFGNTQVSIPFSEIASFFDNEEACGVNLKDGRVLNAESNEAYQRLVLKRMRYELLMGTLSGVEHDVNSRVSFMEEVAKTVADQVESLRANYLQNTKTMTSTVNEIKTATNDVLNSLSSEVSDVSSTCKDKLNIFDKFSTDTYEVKMRKVDKIIDAFKELLD